MKYKKITYLLSLICFLMISTCIGSQLNAAVICNYDSDLDVDGMDLSEFINMTYTESDISVFASVFGTTDFQPFSSNINDLNIVIPPGANPDSITLSWTVPAGNFSDYDIRYATKVIRDGDSVTGEINWEDAEKLEAPPLPNPSLSNQSITITGLSEHKIYYFVIRTISENGTLSSFSNKAVGFTNPYNNHVASTQSSHPRIWLTSEVLADVIDKIAGPYQDEYLQLKNWVENTPAERTSDYALGTSILEISAIGLVAWVEHHQGNTDPQYFERIKNRGALAADYELGNNTSSVNEVALGNKIQLLSICLDWGWHHISQQEKDDWAAALLFAEDYLPNIIRRDVYQGWTRRVHSGSIYAAAALLDEGYCDSQARTLLNYSGVWKLKNSLLAAFNHIGTDGGFFISGLSYTKSFAWSLARQMKVWESLTGEDLFATSGGMRDLPLCLAQYTLPKVDGNPQQIGELIRVGEGINPVDLQWSGNHAFSMGRPLLGMIAAYYNNGLGQYYKNLQPGMSGYLPSVSNRDNIWPDILWGQKDIEQTTPEMVLPASTDIYHENAGVVLMKDPEEVVMFKATDWYYGHQHGDAGTFQIFYKNPLAIRSGFYDWWSGNNSVHYFRNTYAYNGLTVYDPVEDSGLTHGGETQGQNTRLHDTPTVEIQTNSDQDIVDVQVEHTESISRIWADITRATRHSDGYNKVDRHIREFVRLKASGTPNPIIVYDRIQTINPVLTKTWLLHSVNPPVENSDTVTITNGNGKLSARTIFPINSTRTIIGGEGMEFWVNDDGSGTGQNFPLSVNLTPGFDINVDNLLGAFRIEVSPLDPSLFDQFLHVLYPMDLNGEMPDTVRLSSDDLNMPTDNMVGVHIKDSAQNYIVLFNKNFTPITTEQPVIYSFQPTTTSTKHFLCGLPPNTGYDIDISTGIDNWVTITVSEGTTYTVSSKGLLLF